MGISLEIKRVVLRTVHATISASSSTKRKAGTGWAETAWSSISLDTRTRDTELRERRVVVLDDFLVRYRAIFDAMYYTLDELFAIFWNKVEKALFAPNSICDTYVMICDDRANVPVFKSDTQTSRRVALARVDAAKGIAPPEPYPDGWHFDAVGITFLDPARGTPVSEKIDLRRLRVSGGGGKPLWNALAARVEAAMWNGRARLRAGRTVQFVFDFEASGAQWWRAVASDPTPCIVRCRGCEPSHSLGEADPALIWWINYLTPAEGACNVAFYVHTTDTDVIPLWLLYEHEQEARTENYASLTPLPSAYLGETPEKLDAYWQSVLARPHDSDMPPSRVRDVYWVSSKEEMVDLPVLGACVASHMARDMFAFFCLACGNCDYVPAEMKKRYSFGIGVVKTLQAVLLMPMRLTPPGGVQLLGAAPPGSIDLFHPTRSVPAFLRLVHARRPAAGRPDASTVRELTQRIAFNMAYWSGAATATRADLTEQHRRLLLHEHGPATRLDTGSVAVDAPDTTE